jgi:hypothetical protein
MYASVHRNVSPALKLLLCQTVIKHCVGNYYLVEERTRTRRGLSFFPPPWRLGFGARDGFKASACSGGSVTAHKAASDSVYDNTDWCDAKSFES